MLQVAFMILFFSVLRRTPMSMHLLTMLYWSSLTMSQPTNIDPQQGFFGRSSSYGRPTSSGDPMNGVLPNPAYSGSTNGSSAPAHSFDTVHIQQLADFHQHQQTMLMQQQQGQQMSQMPKPVQPNQLRAANQQRLQMPQPQQAITQFTQTAHQPVSSHQVQLQSLPQLQQPQRSISQQQPQTRPNSVQPQQQMRVPQSLPQQQLGSHPALSSSSSMPPRQSSPPRSNNALRPSIPVTQTFQVPAQGLPTSSPNKAEPRSNDPSGSAKPWRPNTAGGWEKDNRTQPLDRRLNASPQAVYLAGAEPIPRRRSPVDRERERDVDMRTSSALADARRRRDEGMRGSMRNESEVVNN